MITMLNFHTVLQGTAGRGVDSVIDKKIKVPLHYQIYLDLLKKIQSGLLRPCLLYTSKIWKKYTMNFRKTKEIFILIKLLFNIHIYIIKTYKMQVY